MLSKNPAHNQFLFDIFVTALEGGIGYWSRCSKYRIWTPNTRTSRGDEVADLANFHAVIHTGSCAPEGKGEHRIDRSTVTRAFSRMRSGDVKHLPAEVRKRYVRAYREHDAGDIDAGAADNIVQIGLFGEVVYG
jgi:hypothetical protein